MEGLTEKTIVLTHETVCVFIYMVNVLYVKVDQVQKTYG